MHPDTTLYEGKVRISVCSATTCHLNLLALRLLQGLSDSQHPHVERAMHLLTAPVTGPVDTALSRNLARAIAHGTLRRA